MIVVTTPTGDIGRQVLAEVLTGSEPVRVVVRDPSKLPVETLDHVEVIQGSHADAGVVAKAFDGAHSLFWLPPGGPTQESAYAAYVTFSEPAVAALPNSGIKRVVAISALGRGWPKDAGHVTATLQADDMFAETGVAYRALACGSLMENTLRQIKAIKQGTFYAPSRGDRQTTAVASRDVAAVAARLLLDNSWSAVEEVPLKGPEELSFNDMAEIMTRVLGKPVLFQETALAELRAMLIDRGVTEGMADATVALTTAKIEGIDMLVPGPTPSLTPTTFASWCRDVLRTKVQGE